MSTDLAFSLASLQAAAKELNSSSDSLGQAVDELDAALKPLNLGLTAWVAIHAEEDSLAGIWRRHQLGHARVGGRWGVALRVEDGIVGNGEPEHQDEWLFNGAPRELRLSAVDHFPWLLEMLIREARRKASQIQQKTASVQAMVEAMGGAR